MTEFTQTPVGGCPLRPGHLLGAYTIARQIGLGSIGNVYEARRVDLEDSCAIKVVNTDLIGDRADVRRFHDAVRCGRRLKEHPYVVEVYESGETDGQCWMAMELVDGIEHDGQRLVTLEEMMLVLPEDVREREDWARDRLREVLAALGYAHRLNIIHGSVKPHNVLLTSDGASKLADFGLAHTVQTDCLGSGFRQRSETGVDSGGTNEGRIHDLGQRRLALTRTWEYMSPEQRISGTMADCRSDLFATGKMAYRMLTGHQLAGLTPASKMMPGIRKGWDEWLERATCPSPIQRYQNAEEMIGAMDQVFERSNHNRSARGGSAVAKVPPPVDRERAIGTVAPSMGAFDSHLLGRSLSAQSIATGSSKIAAENANRQERKGGAVPFEQSDDYRPEPDQPSELTSFLVKQRQRLLELERHLRDLIADMHCNVVQMKSSSGGNPALGLHLGDAASDSTERDFILGLLTQESDALWEIVEALKRIDGGTYGVCEKSGKKIPHERLEAIPWARHTVECQAELERASKSRNKWESHPYLMDISETGEEDGEEEE